jgi:hypothetical protein
MDATTLGGAARVRAASLLAVLLSVMGCASLAVNPCDTVPDRDGKYFGRFFLGVATLGLSEVTIQQEEVRQAYTGSADCPLPSGVRTVSASHPDSAGARSVALGTLVNGTRWTLAVYLNQDPDERGASPLTFLFPGTSLQLGFQPGEYRLLARPTGASDVPRLTWSREMEIDPRVRSFKLEFEQANFQ